MSRYIVIETLISMAINAIISAGFVFFIFGGRAEVGLWGSGGLAIDFVPQTFMITLMSVLVPTALTRRRIRAGTLAPGMRQATRLPRNILLRALLAALLATILVGGAATLVTAALWNGPIGFKTLLLLKVSYGALVGLLVTPLALRSALADEYPMKDSR